MNDLLVLLAAVVGFNMIMFVPAYLYKTDKLTDISYSLSFVMLILFAYIRSDQSVPHTILTLLVLWWAVRLGSFLLMRVWKKGKDARFDGMRESPIRFSRFWLLQGVSVFVVLLGCLQFMSTETPKITIVSSMGVAIYLIGLYIESAADLQKWNFSKDKKNKGTWIEQDLWAKSRHPNYFGEILVWLGIYVYIVPSLTTAEKLSSFISPLYIVVLLLFVSGIPLLEKSADKKWGTNKDYQAYKKRVPKLIPTLKRHRSIN